MSKWFSLILSIVLLILLPMQVFADNVGTTIKSFNSQIVVDKRGALDVKETIIVASYDGKIKHGIYRDFPTRYVTPQGTRYDISFKLNGVTLDGQPTDDRVVNISNGLRIYVGDKDVTLTPGEHTFTIDYTVFNELGYFKDHDELYWNVTGNGWAFPIKLVSATIKLPQAAYDNITGTTAYTGSKGDRGSDFQLSKQQGLVQFSTTRVLRPHEGLAIVVGWPKGYVSEPSAALKLQNFYQANTPLMLMLGGLLVLLVYYLIVWSLLGRDPARVTVVPLYGPPTGFSPAALRYIKDMGYDDRVFTAAIVNMAVKEYLTIEQLDKKKYKLNKLTDDQSKLTEPEKKIANNLFQGSNDILVSQVNRKHFSKATKAFKQALKSEFRRQYFVVNRVFYITGVIISLVAILPMLMIDSDLFSIFFLLIFFFIYGHSAYRTVIRGFMKKGRTKLLGVVFSIALFLMMLFVVGHAIAPGGTLYLVVVSVFLIVNLLFQHLLKKPTRQGVKLIAQVDGFKMFLNATEKDRMNFRNPPDKTPQLFEKYLPYALALGVEQNWCEQFNSVFNSLDNQRAYLPAWYIGTAMTDFNPTNFSNGLASSFGSAIASAGASPGSSSGFGGGSSGGGGGGGGGGGW